jgi:fused signal recognition particle receptor
MPSGIVPELLIALALVAIIGAVFFLAPRRKKPDDAPRTKESGPVVTPPQPEETVTEDVPQPTPTPSEKPRAVPPPEPEFPQAAVAERPSLRDRLSRSRKFLSDRLADAFHGVPDEDTWDDVEAALIQADIGVELATKIVEDLKDKARERRVNTSEDVRALLADELVTLFGRDLDRGLAFAPTGTTVWLVVGVNGTGKTTTIGKLARDLSERGRTVALAAADTFRAAADEQLAVWGARSNAEVISHQQGADPGAVAYDAYQFARARKLDVLIVDTAGRLHTKTPLMDELAKVRRVIEKEGQVHEALLVIDATAGQNGLTQAREFAEASGVTGVVLTKLDGTAKGGIAIAIEDTLSIPIKLIGVGEGIDDLEPFDPKTFVDALLS